MSSNHKAKHKYDHHSKGENPRQVGSPGRSGLLLVGVAVVIGDLFGVIEVGGDVGLGRGLVVIVITGGRARGGPRGVVGGVAEGGREALAAGDGDGKALAAEALVAVVVAGEEEGLAHLQERDGDGDRPRFRVRRIANGPLCRVRVVRVARVAQLVDRLVVGLGH